MSNVNAVSALLSDFASRVKSTEEKLNILRERVLVLTRNFIKREREFQKDSKIIKEENKELRLELKRINDLINNLTTRQQEYARKEELAVVEKYFKLFDPVKFVTSEELDRKLSKKK